MLNLDCSRSELLDARATLLERAACEREKMRTLREEKHRLAGAHYEQLCQAHEAMLVSVHRLAMLRLDVERQHARARPLDAEVTP